MPLQTGSEWVTVWQAYWPINQCRYAEHGVHLMQHSGELWQCTECGCYFTEAESPDFMAAAQRIMDILNDRHRKN